MAQVYAQRHSAFGSGNGPDSSGCSSPTSGTRLELDDVQTIKERAVELLEHDIDHANREK
jgi:hypothetical protein